MALARARRERSVEYWPGFVDALSTLVLGIVFLLSTFVVVQFYLSQEVTGKDTALARLNAQIAELMQLLSMEKTGKTSLEEMLSTLRANLATAEGERDRFKGLYEGLGAGAADAQGKATALSGQLDARAGAGRTPQPADRRAAPPACCARGRARSLGEEGQGGPRPHRRSRPATQRGARPAGAGIVALSFGILRTAARHSRQPAGYPRRRRSLRVPVGSAV